MTPDGFIANPRQSQPGCLIKPRRLVEMAEERAGTGCGLHYELYHFEVVTQLRRWHDMLGDPADRDGLLAEAERRGYSCDDAGLQAAREEREALLDELREEMV
ncbi:hypothetical protein [Halomonas sp. THAF12]|uniref:hypothetical protein n=1 Tax=Halomonas sp. THAF12 TaxID=2587849 RepID=UPI0015622DEA|nr:hypothetical protein [Halomonas sp. THAF12]